MENIMSKKSAYGILDDGTRGWFEDPTIIETSSGEPAVLAVIGDKLITTTKHNRFIDSVSATAFMKEQWIAGNKIFYSPWVTLL